MKTIATAPGLAQVHSGQCYYDKIKGYKIFSFHYRLMNREFKTIKGFRCHVCGIPIITNYEFARCSCGNEYHRQPKGKYFRLNNWGRMKWSAKGKYPFD